MKKIIILGSGGMLGHMVCTYLNNTGKYIIKDVSYPTSFRSESYILDITNKIAVEQYIFLEKPDIVINCIGILIKGSILDPANAIYINSYFPHALSKIVREIGGRSVHISTDCVFSGKKGLYSESDSVDAADIYGLSKALGEIYLNPDLTIRTSIIGPELKTNGEGLFHWFILSDGKIHGYTKAFWTGVTTLELSKAIDAAIEQNLSGLYHLSNSIKISKNNLLNILKKIWNKSNIEIEPIEGKNVDKSLITSRVDFKYQTPSYEKMLIELRDFMIKNKSLYNQYF